MEELEDTKGICVDTDVLIDFLKNKEPGSRAYGLWRSRGPIAITSVTAFELLFGARRSDHRRHEEAKSLIEQQQRVLPFDKSAADRVSEIGTGVRRLGKGIEIRDLLNASICVDQNIPMLTRKKDHYERVPGLKILGL